MIVLLRNARIVTGDGSTAAFLGDVLIADEMIAELGAVPLSEAQRDARSVNRAHLWSRGVLRPARDHGAGARLQSGQAGRAVSPSAPREWQHQRQYQGSGEAAADGRGGFGNEHSKIAGV
jgi:hypothetical protein